MLAPPLSAFSPAKCSGCSILLRYHLCCPADGGTGLLGGRGKPTLLGCKAGGAAEGEEPGLCPSPGSASFGGLLPCGMFMTLIHGARDAPAGNVRLPALLSHTAAFDSNPSLQAPSPPSRESSVQQHLLPHRFLLYMDKGDSYQGPRRPVRAL